MKREKLPDAVRDKLNSLEGELGKRLAVLRVYKDHYYIYSYEMAVAKADDRRRSVVRYIGKIDEKGGFSGPKYRDVVISAEPIEAMNASVRRRIDALGASNKSIAVVPKDNLFYVYDTSVAILPKYVCTISGNGTTTYDRGAESGQQKDAQDLDRADLTILRCLSMNARMPLRDIANLAGITPGAVFRRKALLEKRYGIRYFAEVDLYELEYSMYLCFVKFDELIPNEEELRTAIAKEPRVQMAATTKGSYDLMMYIVAKNSDDVTTMLYRLRQGALKDYKSRWRLMTYNNYYGYIPLRDEFFDLIEEERVWYKEKDSLSKPKDKMTYTEYVVLRELNTNGDFEFAEVAKRFDLKPQNVQYAYHALKEKYKYLQRITLTMNKAPLRYDAVIFMEVIDMSAFLDTRKNLLLNVIEEAYPINKYALVGDITSPYGAIFIVPIRFDELADAIKNDLVAHVRGIEVNDLIITQVIVGRMCYRFFRQYVFAAIQASGREIQDKDL
ncbi:transcriptional regulator, AsnC family [mine drainage metagenome]|uniref:Transcriptional regulator, AsnC family n=1 Tax=mine drainage metagenome TaxID=410659 RepID=T0Y5E5_9ZZZZ